MKKYPQFERDVSLLESTETDNDFAEIGHFLSKRNADKKIERKEIRIGSYFPFRIGGKLRFTYKKHPKNNDKKL